MIGIHGIKDRKINPFILRRFTLLPLGWLNMKFCLSPSFYFSTCSFVHVEKNSHLKTLRNTALSTEPWSAVHLPCTNPPMDYIGCPWLSEGCVWDKRGGRACIPVQPTSCCWRMLLNAIGAASDSVRRRPVPQKPRSYLCAFLSGLSLCTNTLLLSHPRQ